MYKILPILLFAYGLALTTNDIYDNSYALIIGIDKYENVSNLDYAVKDAESVEKLLNDQFKFPAKNITTLLNEEATLSNIKNPYDTKVLALRKQSGHTTGADADVGYITVGGHNTIPLVAVNGCVALKCDPTPNRIWANLCFQASC